MTVVPDVAADQALKARHRALWALGDYTAVATRIIPSLGPVLVDATGIGPGQRVLDVAAGAGNVALPAARAGAQVVASDLTPELLEAGRHLASAQLPPEASAAIEWREADAEALPFPDASFDAVVSCVGVMFAPHHQASADELVRVCRRGGTIGLISWTPEGFIGQMFAAMKPYAAPPPAGAQPPPLWGAEEHVRGLLGERVSDLSMERRRLRVDQFADPAAFREFFKAYYGPTIATYRGIADDPDRVAGLDAALDDLVRRFDIGSEAGTVMEWEYLLVTAHRA